MGDTGSDSSTSSGKDRPPTPEEIQRAFQEEIVDKDGNKLTLGQLVKDKRVVLVFIRHFWCSNCQMYTHHLSKSIPPSSLPAGTELIIIGCGQSSPIHSYLDLTQSVYPVYSCPSTRLHKIFGFTVNLAASPSTDGKKDYMSALTVAKGTWLGIKNGLMRNPGHALDSTRGPKGQNGGEVIIERDGTCSFMHRMQYTDDHTDLDLLAEAIGATYVPMSEQERKWVPGDMPGK
ncbi:hypothetical protein IAU60_002095 [Kwoniella sp. DSM 27419]